MSVIFCCAMRNMRWTVQKSWKRHGENTRTHKTIYNNSCSRQWPEWTSLPAALLSTTNTKQHHRENEIKKCWQCTADYVILYSIQLSKLESDEERRNKIHVTVKNVKDNVSPWNKTMVCIQWYPTTFINQQASSTQFNTNGNYISITIILTLMPSSLIPTAIGKVIAYNREWHINIQKISWSEGQDEPIADITYLQEAWHWEAGSGRL